MKDTLPLQQLADSDTTAFKQQLYQMWFRPYTREVRDDSSGFEHVFVGEARDGKILGLHNWVQFSDQEQKGRLDYKGYIYPRVHRLATFHFCCSCCHVMSCSSFPAVTQCFAMHTPCTATCLPVHADCAQHAQLTSCFACFACTAFSNAELLQLLTVLLVALEVNKKR